MPRLSRGQALLLVAALIALWFLLGPKDWLIYVAFWCVFLPADLLWKRHIRNLTRNNPRRSP